MGEEEHAEEAEDVGFEVGAAGGSRLGALERLFGLGEDRADLRVEAAVKNDDRKALRCGVAPSWIRCENS